MRNFRDLNVKPVETSFVGDKIKIQKIVGKPITVHDYKVVGSKFEKGSGRCLHLQIMLAEEKHVVFTGATGLMSTIQQVQKEDLPFSTTILLQDERYIFT